MYLKDVQTLNSNYFNFNISDEVEKDVFFENQIGYLTYGHNNKWLFDINRYAETKLICDPSTLNKIRIINEVLGTKLFIVENVYGNNVSMSAEFDNGAVIQIGKNVETTENPDVEDYKDVNIEEEDSKFYLTWGTGAKALIINNENSNIFSDAGDFKTVNELFNFLSILDEKEINVIENDGQKYVLSIKGKIILYFQDYLGNYSGKSNSLEKNDVGNIVISENKNGIMLIFRKHLVYTFELSEKWQEKELTDIINQGKVILSQIITMGDDCLQLYVQQYDNYRNHRLVFKNMPLRCSPELLKKLPENNDNFFISINKKRYFVCQIAESKDYVFTIYTRLLRIKVEKKLAVDSKIDGNKYILNVKSVEKRNRGRNVIPNLSLVEGDFYFLNKEEVINDEINQIIDNLVKSKSSYLQTWDKYAETRGNELLETARNFGVLYYDGISFDSNNKVSITLKNCLPVGIDLSDSDSFDIYENVEKGENLPLYMLKENKEMDWKAYYKATEKGAEDDLTEEQIKDEELVYEINKLAGNKKNNKGEKKV